MPTAEDDLIINATCTGTVTVSANAKCRSLDTTGYKGKLKVEKTVSVGGATVNGSNLAIRLGSETLVEIVGVGAFSLVCSKAAATQEVFCNGTTFGGAVKVSAGATVKVKFGDQFVTSGTLELVKGIIEVGASGWKAGGFLSEGELVRELKMGSGTLKMTGSWSTSGANLTVTKETSTLELTVVSGMNDGSSFSYNIVTVAHSSGALALGKGNPTIATLNINPTGTGSVSFTEGSTTTVTTLATTASSGAKIKVKSGTKGVKYAIKATAKQTITGWELEDCEALGGINFIDSGGVDLGGNVNWTFEGGGGTPTTIALAAAAGESATSAAVKAKTQVPLTAAAGESATSASVTAQTTVALAAAGAESASSASVKAQTTLTLAAAVGDSAASAALTARTTITLAAAVGTSASIKLTIELPAPGRLIPLAAASGESATSTLALKAKTVVVLAPAEAESAATAHVTSPAPILVGSGGAEVLVGSGGSTTPLRAIGAGGSAGSLAGMGGKG